MTFQLSNAGGVNDDLSREVHGWRQDAAKKTEIDLSGVEPNASLTERIAWALLLGLEIGTFYSRFNSKRQHSTSSIPQTIARPRFHMQDHALAWAAIFRLMLVFAGCLGVFGVHLRTVSSQPDHPVSVALPGRRGGSADRLACQKEGGGEGLALFGGEAASYARFSSDLQSADSIATQQRNCRERAVQNGHQILAEFEYSDQAVSGTKLRRTGLDALLEAAAQRKFKVLYFYSLSRLARESVITMPVLKRLVYVDKVRVICVSEGLDSQRDDWEMIAMLLSLQHERFIADLSRNVFRGQEGAVFAGFSVGDYCFGYKSMPSPDGQRTGRGRNAKPRMVYVIDIETAKWVHRIFHWFVYERRSIRWITRELNRLGAPKDHRATTSGWHHQYVAKLLSNPKYVGRWSWGQKKNVRNPLTGQIRQEERPVEEQEKWLRHLPHLQIVDDADFENAQKLLAENKSKYAKKRKSNGTFCGGSGTNGHPRHLLSGLIECGECGATFRVGGANGKYLFCPSYHRGECPCQTQLRRDRAERMILDEIGRQILANPEWRQAVLDAEKAAWASHQSSLPSELTTVESQLATVDRKISALLDRMEDDDKTPELSERLAQRREEKRKLIRKVEKLKRKSQNRGPAPTLNWVDERLQKLGATLLGSIPAANEALKELVDGKIVVYEIRQDGRQRYHLRGRLRIRCGSVQAAMGGSAEERTQDDENPPELVKEILIDFVEPDEFNAKADEAKALYDQGLMCAEIAKQLGCARSYVTKLLTHWHVSRDLPVPDGRARRSQLKRKHLSPPKYQEVADEVRRLAEEGHLLGEIAQKLGLDRNTVTKAWVHWHESRDLPVPDGRTRRKSLGRKSASSPDEPPLTRRDPHTP